LGVLNDMSSLYADVSGRGGVIAAQMAVEDFGGKVLGAPIEIVSGDHQNKPDVGAGIARQWIDADHVDAIVDVPTSSVALAVQDVTREKKRVFLMSGPGSSDLTGKACSPYGVHWTYDTYALAHGTGGAIVKQGGTSWFFITADYAFGQDLEKQASEEVKKEGGHVLGSVRHPLGAADFSSFLLQAQASGAQVIGLANAGGDTVNTIKQAAEFNLGEKQKIVALIFDLQSVPALGLKTAQGIVALNAFYWDFNDKTRAWSARYQERYAKKEMPNHMQAGVYSGAMAYLNAVDRIGSPTDGRAVVAAMKATPIDDPLFGHVTIREDGRAMHDMYLLQVKSPAESKSTWDVFKVIGTIDAEHAFRPLNEGGCPLVAK
jgi:branched-chain amino acid transport system substrate-binding protein